MTPHEIFAYISPAQGLEVIEFTQANEKELYRAALQAVAQARKVRVVFLERQPRAQRHAAMLASLSRRALEPISDNLLRNWLLKKHVALLGDFLDALRVSHQNGLVETLPEQVDDAALQAAVENLFAKYPAEIVVIYLHAFNHMNEARWANLDTLLQNDPRCQWKPPAQG
jgi:hypothetical protein